MQLTIRTSALTIILALVVLWNGCTKGISGTDLGIGVDTNVINQVSIDSEYIYVAANAESRSERMALDMAIHEVR